MNPKPWQFLDSQIVVSNQWLKLRKNRYKLPSGTVLDDFFVLERDDFVLVVASYGEQILLVRQYRPGTDRNYLALPAGYVNPGERPEGSDPSEGNAISVLELVRNYVIPETRRRLAEQAAQPVPEAFWSHLHPRIRAVAKPRFDARHFSDAVEAAMKEVNSEVKTNHP